MKSQRRLILVLSTLLLSLANSAAYGAELHRVFRLLIFDANNKLIGDATPLSQSQAVVGFRVGGHIFEVFVAQDRFWGLADIYFESPDTTCSGTPLMRPLSRSFELLPLAAVAPPGSTVYIPDPQAVPRRITVGSLSQPLLQGECVVLGGEFNLEVVPSLALIDLDTKFTPPFRVSRVGF